MEDPDEEYKPIPTLQEDYEKQYGKQAPPDIAKEHIAFLDNAIKLLQPPDLFGSQQNPNAWFNLHSDISRNTLAAIHVFLDDNKDHPLVGEITSKVGLVIKLLKQRFNNPDAYRDFNADIGKRIKRLRETPQGGKVNIVNTGRQVRSQLLMVVADNFGYEMHRDDFDDFADTIRNDRKRHYDSLIEYYNSFEAHYDPDFKCIDELVDICDTENDDYTREGLRSWNIGHIQRAFFPGCELQRLITLIGDENIGKSSLIKMKAGNLLWDEKGGIKAIRWYSNKNIINPLMSDRDRHSACIGINVFEFDERRGQRAIENEHFRSFVTSTYDDFRIWQGMEPVRVLRRWDMIPSTNHGDYYSDGFIRRDWGINVGVTGRRINLPKFLALYPKITAWAVHHVKAGMSAIPDYNLYQKAKIKQRSRIRQTDTMDFLEPVFAFAHLYDNEETKIVSKAGAIRLLEKYHLSYKDDKETKQRIYMIDQTGLSNFASDYKRFYNRSGNTDKHAIKNDILNVEVRPVVDEKTADTDLCFMWKPMTKPVNMWSTFLNRSIRGYILVIDAPHVVLMEAYAFNVMSQHLPFIEAVLGINKTFEDVSKLKNHVEK